MADKATQAINNQCLNPDNYKSQLSPGAKRMKTSGNVDEYIKATPLPKSKNKVNNANDGFGE